MSRIVRVGSEEITGEDHGIWDGEFFITLCCLLGAVFEDDILPWLSIFQLGEGNDGWLVVDSTAKIIGQRLWAPLKEYIDRISRQAPPLMEQHKWSRPLLQLHLNAVMEYREKYDPEKVMNFGGFALAKDLRGSGIAEILMRDSIETIRSIGTYTHITVQCTSVRSRKWMERFGFRVEHEWSYPEEYQNKDLLKKAGFDSVQHFTLLVLEL